MKRQMIFKCEGANRGFVHVYLCIPYNGEEYYEVMRNRRRVAGVSRWRLPSDAVAHAVRLSLQDVVNVCKVNAL